MKRYWFKLDLTINDDAPLGTVIGCGVTANDKTEAIFILKEKVFYNKKFPSILNIIENVDISTLDKNHVIPNMGNPIEKGVWFPFGY